MPTQKTKRTADAHRKTVETTIERIAKALEEVFGRKLVALMANVEDPKTVGNWTRGQQPHQETEERLRAAYQVFQLLLTTESAHTVRAWFIGLNPQLDDASPAEAIRDGRAKDVLVAARSYVAGG